MRLGEWLRVALSAQDASATEMDAVGQASKCEGRGRVTLDAAKDLGAEVYRASQSPGISCLTYMSLRPRRGGNIGGGWACGFHSGSARSQSAFACVNEEVGRVDGE